MVGGTDPHEPIRERPELESGNRTDGIQSLLRGTYEAFNARDIERALAAMHPQFDWPDGMEGGRLNGHGEVREHWRTQFELIDSRVSPHRISRRNDGRFAVEVHQLVRDRAGDVISDQTVEHLYEISEGSI